MLVGIRELKAHLSAYLKQVKAGAILIITERGHPIGRIVPVSQKLEERVQELSQAGLVAWSGKSLQPTAPVARSRGDRTVAELLLEERR
ncbi:MAG: type II toxin-antitoxin system Phd/YefM family antitoxin [Anaerolineae bacterium]